MRIRHIAVVALSVALISANGSAAPTPDGAVSPNGAIGREVTEAVAAAGEARVHVVIRGGEKIERGASEQSILRLGARMEALNAAFRRDVEAAGGQNVRVRRYSAGLSVDVTPEVLDALGRMPQVEAVFLDSPVVLHLAQGVPQIGATILHSLGHTGAGTSAAIIDTGVDWLQPSLGGCLGPGCRVLEAVSFCDHNSDPMDFDGHGTAVAGIVAANLGSFRGVAPDANLVGLRVFGTELDGCSGWDPVIEALKWVIDHRLLTNNAHNIQVVNLSLGDDRRHKPGDPMCTNHAVASNIQTLVSLGIAVTVSSGNRGFDGGIEFPACVPEAVAVGAVYDQRLSPPTAAQACGDTFPVQPDQFICYTSAGPNLDLLAPSWKCDTTGFPGFQGTSASAPYVAGGFLVLDGMAGSASPVAIEQAMKAHGVPVDDPTTEEVEAYPRLDLAATSLEYDADSDGVIGLSDNCPFDFNSSQADGDGDGHGDVCDNCPLDFNPDQGIVGAPVVTVTWPNGDEILTINDSVNLQWSATDTCGGVSDVDLLLSRNGVDGSYEPLFLGIPNSGSQAWTVTGPATVGSTAFLKAVARDPAANTGQDASNAGFRIQNPQCGPCQTSYCSDMGVRCTFTDCSPGGCCNYQCGPDFSCQAPDPCPPNACSCF